MELIVAHNLYEGLLFTDPRVTDQAGFESYFAGLMPSVRPAKLTDIATKIYPEDYSGKYPYKTATERLALAVGEGLIDCWAFGLGRAYKGNPQSYQLSLFPGIHSQDIAYTFYNGETADSLGEIINPSVAAIMQGWFTDYAQSGDTEGSTATQLPAYGCQGAVLNITDSGSVIAQDPAANPRCQFWLNNLMS